MQKVVALTDKELEEPAQCEELQEGFGRDSAEDLRSELQESFVAKFPTYITDGPGYSGPLIVIVTGIMSTILVSRADGKFEIQWPN